MHCGMASDDLIDGTGAIEEGRKEKILEEISESRSVCLTRCDPMDYTVRGILQARILEWVAFPFSRGSSQPRDWTRVSCIAGGFFTNWATRDALDEIKARIFKKFDEKDKSIDVNQSTNSICKKHRKLHPSTVIKWLESSDKEKNLKSEKKTHCIQRNRYENKSRCLRNNESQKTVEWYL